MAQTQRYEWADFMRGLMMILVVLYHSEVYYFNAHTLSWVFEPFFLTGFFFVSGYFFTRDIESVILKDKVKQVFRAIVVPYFVFTLLLALSKLLVVKSDTTQMFIDILMLRASWFVIAIGVMQILYALILSVKKTMWWLSFSTIVIFAIGYASIIIYRESPAWLIANRWLNSPDLMNRFPLCLNLVFVQIPFFYLGIIYKKNESKINIYFGWSSFIILFFLYFFFYLWIDHNYIGSRMCVVVHSYNNIFLVFFYAIIAICALMSFCKIIKNVKPINYIGKHSILFYFLNGGALTIVSAIMKKFSFMEPSNYLNQIIVAIIAIAFMFPCVWFINKYLPVLSGNKDSFNRISMKLGLKINW